MTHRPLIISLAAAVSGLVLGAQEAPRAVTAPARQELVVTNQNLAVVVESRTVTLPTGTTTLRWHGAPASARTETWSVTNAREAGVRWLGLISPFAGQGGGDGEWLAGLVGKRVRVRRVNGEMAEADVVAVYGPTPAQVLFREGASSSTASRTLGSRSRRIRARPSARPASRSSSSERAGSRTLTSRYLVSDLSWEAAYALALSPTKSAAGSKAGSSWTTGAAGSSCRPGFACSRGPFGPRLLPPDPAT